MITNTIQIRSLIPEEGKTLTNGDVYSKLVYLGIHDSAENWNEIPDEEVPEEYKSTLGIL